MTNYEIELDGYKVTGYGEKELFETLAFEAVAFALATGSVGAFNFASRFTNSDLTEKEIIAEAHAERIPVEA